MFGRDEDSIYRIGTTVVVVAAVLLLGFYGIVLADPDTPLNPFPPARAPEVTAVALAATPTLPATWTPTPTHTGVPTSTLTPTVTGTATPTATATASHTPTVEPTPTETPTETPTPEPSPTPIPPPYEWINMMAGSDCTWSGIFGVVWSATDMPLEGVQIHLWTDQGLDYVSGPTDVDGNYVLPVASEPLAARWFVQVIEGGTAQSATLVFETSKGCQNGLQKYRIDWRRTQ